MSTRSRRRVWLAWLVAALVPATWGAEKLGPIYADVLSGDVVAAQAAVKQAASGDAGDPALKLLGGWLDHYDGVLAARRDIKQRSVDWHVEQARDALDANKPYLALAFAARGVAYCPDPNQPYADAAWTDKLVERSLAEADKFAKSQQWAKAMAYYSMLERVRPGDKHISALHDAATRHARLELLYKNKDELQRRVAGATFDLLRSAVRLINRNYYQQPDFRRAANGSLDNLVTLCETGKLAEYLDGVANPASREFFLKRLGELRKAFTDAPQFDYKDFLKLYQDIKEANDKSLELPEGLLVVEFVEGALAKLDDFSAMVWPADATEFDKMMMGGFEGVGIQLGVDEYTKRLRVITPLESSPALEAGIEPGDLIVEVEGKSTMGWTTEDAVRNIMGKAGSQVTLTMYRPSAGKRLNFTLTRRQIELRTVRGVTRLDGGHSTKWDYMLDKASGVAYLRLSGFNPNSGKEMAAALDEAHEQGMRGLVLDLRSNPGGLLDVAIEIVSLFVADGEVVSTDGLSEPKQSYKVLGDAKYADLPVVVLINEGSASAAEILSGALQDHHRALIVGERSFGKGSVQRVLPLGADARLKLTTALYYLPSGRSPHKVPDAKRWGVDPDWQVKLNPKEFRRVIDREQTSYIIRAAGSTSEPNAPTSQPALDDLTDDTANPDADLLTDADIKRIESDPIKVPDQDPQLETALLIMRVKVAGNLPWPKHVAVRTAAATIER